VGIRRASNKGDGVCDLLKNSKLVARPTYVVQMVFSINTTRITYVGGELRAADYVDQIQHIDHNFISEAPYLNVTQRRLLDFTLNSFCFWN
jgi:hypothetical protein